MQLSGFADATAILKPGVYALGLHGSVVYVGKAKCMLVRIYTHRNLFRKKVPAWMRERFTGVEFDQVFLRPCPVSMLDALEREMINLYKPRLNSQLKEPGLVKAPLDLVVAGVSLKLNSGVEIKRRV